MLSNRRAIVAQIADQCPMPNVPTMDTTIRTEVKVALSDESHFFFDIMWMAGCMCVTDLGKKLHQGVIWIKGKLVEFNALSNVLLGNLGSYHSCECYFDTYHLPKHCC